jgi:hypothetical protein
VKWKTDIHLSTKEVGEEDRLVLGVPVSDIQFPKSDEKTRSQNTETHLRAAASLPSAFVDIRSATPSAYDISYQSTNSVQRKPKQDKYFRSLYSASAIRNGWPRFYSTQNLDESGQPDRLQPGTEQPIQ